jgi:hypothetical protein
MYETDEENDRDVEQQSELERHSDVRTDASTVADNRQHYCPTSAVLLFSKHLQLLDSLNITSIIVSLHVVEN